LRDVRILFAYTEQIVSQKDEIQELLDMLLVWYRDLAILQAQGELNLIANADVLDRLQQMAAQQSVRQTWRLFELVYQAKLDLLRNANLQLTVEVLLISLTEVYNDRIRWR
jgi:DNA polymerase III subunit delta'